MNENLKRSTYPLNPLTLIGFTTFLFFYSIHAGPAWSQTTGFHWYVNQEHVISVWLGVFALFAGLLIARLTTENVKEQPQINVQVIVDRGRILCYLAIVAYILWFVVSSDQWLHPNPYGHVQTVPGLTTLTQILPLGLACIYVGQRIGYSKPQDKWILLFTLALTVERATANHERLALAETLIPLLIVYLVFTPWKRGVSVFTRSMLLPFLAFGATAVFAVFEYSRSWVHYSQVYSGGYLSFAIERLQTYYISALNNGAIYELFSKPERIVPYRSLDFIWQFPVIGTHLLNSFNSNFTFDFAVLLKEALGTDEFNNAVSVLILKADLSRIGMMVVLFLTAFGMSRLHSRLQNGDYFALVMYASLVVGLFELPLIFWFSLGKTLPVFVALIWLRQGARSTRENQIFEKSAMSSKSNQLSIHESIQ